MDIVAQQATFQLLPSLTESEYTALKDDIRQHGVLVPIEVDDQGNILDGHHRVKAWSELRAEGIALDDYQRIVRIGLSDAEKRAHAIRLNINRRHLTRSQRDELIVTLRQMTTPQGAAVYSTREIADMVGVTHPTVVRAMSSTGTNVPVEMPSIVQGKDGKLRDAKRPAAVISKNADEQARAQQALALLGDAAPEGVSDLREIERAAKKAAQPPVKAEPPPLPPRVYRCIVVDPPWEMDKIAREVRPKQLTLDYPQMSEDELRAFPLPDLAADDCHLYLWTTHKYLPVALRLAEHWGFKYQCLLTWRKNVGFTPFSWMYSTEHALFCRRGNLNLLQLGRRLDFDAPVREHSRKPDAFYDLVRDVSPGPRLDIFAREQHSGFEVWGNETALFGEGGAHGDQLAI